VAKPEAVITVQGEAAPYGFGFGTMPKAVVLVGTGSSDPDGFAITGYSWKLLDRPQGSVAAVSDNGDGPAGITLDVVGAYHVFLEVTDAQGEQSEGNPFKAKDPSHCYLAILTQNRSYWMPTLGQRNWKALVEAIWFDIDAQLGSLGTSLTAHLNDAASKHDADQIDYERAAGSKKNIAAGSVQVEAALSNLDDATGKLTDLSTTDKASVVAAINELAAGEFGLPNTAIRVIGDGDTVSVGNLVEPLANGRIRQAPASSIIAFGIVINTTDGAGPTTGDAGGTKKATIQWGNVASLRIKGGETVNAGKRVKPSDEVNQIVEAGGTDDGSLGIALETGTGNNIDVLLLPTGDV